MKVSRFAIGISAAAILILAGLVGELLWSFGIEQRDLHMPVPEEFAQQITVHENEDFVYSYTLSDVALDEETLTLYVPNLVNVFTEQPLSRKEKEALAEQAGGTVVTDISGCINLVQLYVAEEDLASVEAAAERAMQEDGVFYAGYEVPIFVEENSLDGNPWLEDGVEQDRGNEVTPGGTDWWAEAIGAYTAWNYEQWFQDVTVGVIDSGFYTQHEDLVGNTAVCMLPGYEENTLNYHGTAVTGIIGAADNEIGLRGVASSQYHQLTMYCADWSPVTNFEGAEDYVNMLVTGEYTETIKEMVERDAKVINNSWCFTKYAPFEETVNRIQHIANKQPMDMWSVYGTYEACVRQTAIHAMSMLVSLLSAEKDVLIVQSAGNGLNNGGQPLSTDENCGVFGNITPELFQEVYGDRGEISYEELYSHILIVGAIQNQQTEDGKYLMASWSNFGPAIDLCAPGNQIFTTTDSTGREADGSRYTQQFTGTSAAAPMVTGAAALLWSIEPDLTAQQVKDLLLQNTRDQAIGTRDAGVDEGGSTGTYPVLNIGAAVWALMKEKNEALISEIQITDQATGEPVEGAEVIYSTGLFEAYETVTTDSDGRCTIQGAANLHPYPAETTVLVKADGQLRWYGTVRAWLEDDPDQTLNEIQLDLNNILDLTGDLLEQLKQDLPALWEYIQTVMDEAKAAQPDFADTLTQLAGQYGVIPLGEESYPEITGYGGGEDLIDPARLTGLLGADIFDYDGDGQEELLTVRLETGGKEESGWIQTKCFFAVYEWDSKTGESVLSDEQSFVLGNFTNSVPHSALHLARGDFDNGETALYLNYHWEMNSLSFGTLRISYDGTLQVDGGVECVEWYAAMQCYRLKSSQNLGELGVHHFMEEQYGWEEMFSFNHPDDGMTPSLSDIDSYRTCYQSAMTELGIEEYSPRGIWMDPERPTGGGIQLRELVDRESIAALPVQRSKAINGTLTTLCGAYRLAAGIVVEEDVTLVCYDESGLLDSFR